MNETEQAFEALVREHKASIYSVCYMFAADKMEADDLFQEALINLWHGNGHLRTPGSLKSWIYRVTLNTCLSVRRKKHIRTEPIDKAAVETTDEESPEWQRQLQLLRDRISRLDVIDRAIVLLWLENMTYEEIGAIVGMSAKGIGVRLVRIKEKLKKTANTK